MADNLVLGRGKLFFTPYAPGTTTGGTRGYFGNTPTVALAQTNTKLDHYSSEGGLKVKDKSIILQADVTITFECDNINYGNLVIWFGGNSSGSAPSDAPTGVGTLAFIGRADAVYGSMLYMSDNPVGENINYWFPYVNLTPNGNYALKGDAWQTLSFTAECLKRDNNTERFYAYTPSVTQGDARADTTAEFTALTASVSSGLTVATGGTVSAPGTGTAAAALVVTYSLTGGDEAWVGFRNGSTNVGSRTLVTSGATTVTVTAPAAGTYTVKLFSDAAGTTVLGTSSNVVIS